MTSIIELLHSDASIGEKLDAIDKLGVFDISLFDAFINISTNKTVSKANYMRLKKMNNNVYMKTIDFNTQSTIENLLILADISIKTNKFSQSSLVATKKARLDGKYKGKQKSTSSYRSHDSAFDVWMDVVGYPPSAAELAAFKKQHPEL